MTRSISPKRLTIGAALSPLATAVALSLSALFLIVGCGGPRTIAMLGTDRVPGAEGRVQVETIEGGNNMVTISVQHLAPPERLNQSATRYVLWFRPAGGNWAMESNLQYDPEARTGRATATTPHPQFDVAITAEGSSAANQPGQLIVFRQQVR
jgi:hypothetical protein